VIADRPEMVPGTWANEHADRFLALVETSLGLTEHAPFRVA